MFILTSGNTPHPDINGYYISASIQEFLVTLMPFLSKTNKTPSSPKVYINIYIVFFPCFLEGGDRIDGIPLTSLWNFTLFKNHCGELVLDLLISVVGKNNRYSSNGG